jgi:hypothetical protein
MQSFMSQYPFQSRTTRQAFFHGSYFDRTSFIVHFRTELSASGRSPAKTVYIQVASKTGKNQIPIEVFSLCPLKGLFFHHLPHHWIKESGKA